jgi:hypothetical protein
MVAPSRRLSRSFGADRVRRLIDCARLEQRSAALHLDRRRSVRRRNGRAGLVEGKQGTNARSWTLGPLSGRHRGPRRTPIVPAPAADSGPSGGHQTGAGGGEERSLSPLVSGLEQGNRNASYGRGSQVRNLSNPPHQAAGEAQAMPREVIEQNRGDGRGDQRRLAARGCDSRDHGEDAGA